MIPYDLIVASASRPHLLKPTLASLLALVDQPPARILIHDDIRSTAREIQASRALWAACYVELVRRCRYQSVPLPLVLEDDPPVGFGLALAQLIDHAESKFALFTQDDFVAVRPIPVAAALATMAAHRIHFVSFHKRATRAVKDTWQGPWTKQAATFAVDAATVAPLPPSIVSGTLHVTLTLNNQLSFQTGLWRVAPMRAALDYWTRDPARRSLFSHPQWWQTSERMLNEVFDGLHGQLPAAAELTVPPPGADPRDPVVRSAHQRTYLFGPIGEDRYVRHIGGDPKDWAGDHARDEGVDDPARAWREIEEHRL